MDVEIIATGDGTRNRKTAFQSKAFFRAVRSVFPYRRALTLGLVASVCYAALHSVSILGVMPILKVLLEEEGLHGWVDRVAANARVDAEFAIRPADPRSGAAAALVVLRVEPGSVAQQQGLAAGNTTILRANSRWDLIQHLHPKRFDEHIFKGAVGLFNLHGPFRLDFIKIDISKLFLQFNFEALMKQIDALSFLAIPHKCE